MHQVGLFAAAGFYALDHNMNKLAQDHINAQLIAKRIATSDRIIINPATVQTNILVFNLSSDVSDAPTVVARARERGLRLFAIGPRTIRAVTHLDVSQEQCEQAAEIFLDIVTP